MQDNPKDDLNFKDPLLGCLLILCKLFQKPISPNAIRSNIPFINENLTPQIFVRAAEKIGISAQIFKRSLTDISAQVLPIVLLLKNDKACILNKINNNQTFELIFPENSEEKIVSLTELQNLYSGYVIFINPEFKEYHAAKVDDEKPMHLKSWFWGTLWHYRKSYINIIFASLFINIFSLMTALFVMNIYDRVVPTFAVTTLWVLSIGIFIIYIFDFILRTLRNYVIDIAGKKSDILMAGQLFQRIVGMKLESKPLSVGEFTHKMTEFEVLRDFFTSITLTTLIDWPFMIVYLIVIFYIGGILALIPLCVIPLIILFMLWLEVPMQSLMKQTIANNSKKNAVLIESISELETIKGLVAESIVQKKWEHFSNAASKSSQRSRFLWTLGVNVTNIAQQLVSVAVVILGVYLIEEKKLTLGGLIACTILTSRAIAPLGQVANVLTRFQRAKMALKSLNKLMEIPSERIAKKHYIYRPKIKGELEFDNVSFSYKTPANELFKVLKNISFKINPGEHVGLLGLMGSGKTTLQKLIMGFYQPDEGAIYLDGIDIKQIDPADLRRFISYVPQNNALLAGTLRDNIMIGCPWATEEEFLNAAKNSGADKIVENHPEGYDYFVGEQGRTLSGGQRQSIVIARALIANGSLYLMDEPTSVTDTQSEVILIERFKKLLENKTLLLTTHRIILLNLVSRVMLLQQGQLVLDGPRDEVLSKLQVNQPKATNPTSGEA